MSVDVCVYIPKTTLRELYEKHQVEIVKEYKIRNWSECDRIYDLMTIFFSCLRNKDAKDSDEGVSSQIFRNRFIKNCYNRYHYDYVGDPRWPSGRGLSDSEYSKLITEYANKHFDNYIATGIIVPKNN